MRYSSTTGWSQVDARVIGEAKVQMSVNGIEWLSFQCTPTSLEELALGFLYNEGIIETLAEIADVQLCPDGSHIDVWTHHAVKQPERWTRTSGCGGGATNSQAPIIPIPILAGSNLNPEKLIQAMNLLQEAQGIYKETGGIHCSALSNGDKILLSCEDIGRHNTIDKIAGHLLRKGLDTRGLILLTTGRISSEMLQKAARMHIEVVVSRTSPTSGSVQLADQAGITLTGYARRDHINIYTHPERLSPAG
jgi:FdhD protein